MVVLDVKVVAMAIHLQVWGVVYGIYCLNQVSVVVCQL